MAKPSSKTADEKARIVVAVLKGELTAVEAAPTLTPSNTCYMAGSRSLPHSDTVAGCAGTTQENVNSERSTSVISSKNSTADHGRLAMMRPLGVLI